MKLAFSMQPPPLLGQTRNVPTVVVSKPKTPPPKDPSPEDAKELPPVSQSSASSLDAADEDALSAATGEAGPTDAGFDSVQQAQAKAEDRGKQTTVFGAPGCPAPQPRWLHSAAMLAGSMYVFGGVTADSLEDGSTALSNRLWSLQTESSYWTLVDAPRKPCTEAFPRRIVHRRPAAVPKPPPPPPTAGFRPAEALREALQGPAGALLPGQPEEPTKAAAELRGRLAARLLGSQAVDAPGQPVTAAALPITDRGLLRGAYKPVSISKLPKPTTRPASGYKDRTGVDDTSAFLQTTAAESPASHDAQTPNHHQQQQEGEQQQAKDARLAAASGWDSPAFRRLPRFGQLSLLAAVARASGDHPASSHMAAAHSAWLRGDVEQAKQHHEAAVKVMRAHGGAPSDASLLQASGFGSKVLPGAGLDKNAVDVESGGFVPLAPSQAKLLPDAPDALWRFDLATHRWSRPPTRHEFVARLRKAVQLTAGAEAMAVEVPGSLPPPPSALLQKAASGASAGASAEAEAQAGASSTLPSGSNFLKQFSDPEMPADLQAQDVLVNTDLGGASSVPAVGYKVRLEGIGLARPAPRALASMVRLQGGLLLFGGMTPSWQLKADAWFFDPSAYGGLGQWWCVWGCPAQQSYAYRSDRTGKPVIVVPEAAKLAGKTGSPLNFVQTSAHAADEVHLRVSTAAVAEAAEAHAAKLAGAAVAKGRTRRARSRASSSSSTAAASGSSAAHQQHLEPSSDNSLRGSSTGAAAAQGHVHGRSLQDEHDPMADLADAAQPSVLQRFQQQQHRSHSKTEAVESDDESGDEDNGDEDGDDDDDGTEVEEEEELPEGPEGPGDDAGRDDEVSHRQESSPGQQLLTSNAETTLPLQARGIPELPFDSAIDALSAAVTSALRLSDSLFPGREGHTAVVVGAAMPRKAVALPPTGMFGGLPTDKKGKIVSAFKVKDLGFEGAPASDSGCGGKPSAARAGKPFTCSPRSSSTVSFGSLSSGSPADMGKLGSKRKEVMLVYGGMAAGHNSGMAHVWAFALQPEPSWFLVSTEGSNTPPRRWLHTAAAVSVRERDVVKDRTKSSATELMVVFGGCSHDGRALDDGWVFNLNAALWHPMRTVGAKPNARWLASAVALAEPRLPRAPAREERTIADALPGDIFGRLALSRHPEIMGTPQDLDSQTALRDEALSGLRAADLVKDTSSFGLLQRSAAPAAAAEPETTAAEAPEPVAAAATPTEDAEDGKQQADGAAEPSSSDLQRFLGMRATGFGSSKPVPGPQFAQPEASDRNYLVFAGGAASGVVYDDAFSLRIMETPKSIKAKAKALRDVRSSKSASVSSAALSTTGRPLPGYEHPQLGAIDAQWDLLAPANPGPAGVEGATMVGVSTGQGEKRPPLLGEERQWALQFGGAREPGPPGFRVGDGEGVPADVFLDVLRRPMLPTEVDGGSEGSGEGESSDEDDEGEEDSAMLAQLQGVVGRGKEQGGRFAQAGRAMDGLRARGGQRGVGQGLTTGMGEGTDLDRVKLDPVGRQRQGESGAEPSGLGAEAGETQGDGSSLTHMLAMTRKPERETAVDLGKALEALVRRDPAETDPTEPVRDDAPSAFLVGGPPRPPRQLPPAAQVTMYLGVLAESHLASPLDERWRRLSDAMPTTQEMPLAAVAEYVAVVEKPALLKELKQELKDDETADMDPEEASDAHAEAIVEFAKHVLKLR